MARSLRWTSADLELFPDGDGKRYEIIDGELHVAKQPDWQHQVVCSVMDWALVSWNREMGLGVVAQAPGLIFAEDENVAPDLVWVSRDRLGGILGTDARLHGGPELIVEVLSPGAANERRDREAKLRLYSRQGVREYWIVDWHQRRVQVYRRAGVALDLTATLLSQDTLQSALLPGFALPVGELFANLPTG